MHIQFVLHVVYHFEWNIYRSSARRQAKESDKDQIKQIRGCCIDLKRVERSGAIVDTCPNQTCLQKVPLLENPPSLYNKLFHWYELFTESDLAYKNRIVYGEKKSLWRGSIRRKLYFKF